MAIIIPSTKIYEIDNPKVRDNVIERIEVNAVEVVPSNKYEEAVFNEDLDLKSNKTFSIKDDSASSGAPPSNNTAIAYGSYSIIYDKYITIDVIINKIVDNYSYISKVYTGKNNNGNSYIKANKSYKENSYFYKVPLSFNMNKNPNDSNYDIGDFVQNKILNYSGQKQILKREETIYNIESIRGVLTCNYKESNGFIDGFETPEYVKESEAISLQSFTTLTKGVITNWYANSTSLNLVIEETNLDGNLDIEETDDYYKIKNLKFFVGRTTYSCGTAIQVGTSYAVPSSFPSQVLEVNQDVVKLELTVLGDTIGIDLTDKIVYIPENDKTSKKVFSVEGNELMQTSNYTDEKIYSRLTIGEDYSWEYYPEQDGSISNTRADIYIKNKDLWGKNIKIVLYESGNDEESIYYYKVPYGGSIIINNGYYFDNVYIFVEQSLIEKQYENLKNKYINGKETATIRCGISDYYDEDGNKQISYESGECFNIYDEVIPYVCGKFGVDKPMSVDKNGNPKVFRVLGREIYYDGAIFQKLFLQEA